MGDLYLLDLDLAHPFQRNLEYHLTAEPDFDFVRKLNVIRTHARRAIKDTLEAQSLDAIVSLADARMASVASLAGFAIGAMPLGYADFNGRAWGLTIITGVDGEKKMLDVMSAWESTFSDHWQPPPLLREEA